MKSPINYSTIDLRIHGIRGLPYEADTNLHYLPFRVTLLRDADEICTESSCHNVFVHSLLNSQWHTNSEEDDNRFTIHNDLDPTNDKTHFRLDLHGRNLCMFTFEINLNTIHRDREAVWCNLINCEGYEIDGAEVQLSVCFDDKPESILKNIHQEQIIEAQKSNICEAQESMFNIEIQMQEMTRGTNEVTEESLIWLSFEFLDNITQTDLFSPDDKSTYPSKAETFQFYGTHEKAWLLLHDDVGVLKIYVCGNSGILTCFHLGLAALFCSEEDAAPVIHQGSREIITNLCHTTRSEHEHGEEKKVSSSSNGEDDSKLQLSITLQIHSATSHSIDHFDMTGGKANGNYHRIESPKISTTRSLDQKKIPRFESSANISKTIDAITNATRKSKAEIVEKRKQWERFRQKEEDKFRKHLKKKEEEVRKYLQHQIQKNEDSHSEAMKTCRNEYLKLELRLKKALVGVESKERETKRKMDDAESAHQKKMNELELSSLREVSILRSSLLSQIIKCT